MKVVQTVMMRQVLLYYFYPCQCFVYTSANKYNIFYRLPLIMRRHELNRSLRYLLISGFTFSKKSLQITSTGKHSITQGSGSQEYFADALSILTLCLLSQTTLLDLHCTSADKPWHHVSVQKMSGIQQAVYTMGKKIHFANYCKSKQEIKATKELAQGGKQKFDTSFESSDESTCTLETVYPMGTSDKRPLKKC